MLHNVLPSCEPYSCTVMSCWWPSCRLRFGLHKSLAFEGNFCSETEDRKCRKPEQRGSSGYRHRDIVCSLCDTRHAQPIWAGNSLRGVENMQSRHLTVVTMNYLIEVWTNHSNYSRKMSRIRLTDQPITTLLIRDIWRWYVWTIWTRYRQIIPIIHERCRIFA
jgi:hypothetical protein